MVGFVKHYALHFRQIYTKDGISTASIWKALVNIKPEYFSGQNISTPRGYLFEHFLNTTGYEINLAIVSNKTILVSASIFADAMDSHHLRGMTCIGYLRWSQFHFFVLIAINFSFLCVALRACVWLC